MKGEIIGRENELKAIETFLDGPSMGLRALVLEGGAGIGKSTLWLAGVAAARERSFRVLVSRPAETERTLAHVVLGDLFAEADPALLDTLSAPRRHAFEAAMLRELSEFPVDPRALGVAILTLLPALTDGQTLVLAIDDDQWMDPSSAAILQFALRRSVELTILLLLARRIDGGPRIQLEDTVGPAATVRIPVGPLSLGAIQVLLRDRLAVSLPRPTLLQLHEVSGGNPFYALELARARSGNSARDATLPWAFPPNLDHLVVARLDGLGEPTRGALLLIAAQGRMPVRLFRPLGIAPGTLDPAAAANVTETVDGVVRFTHPLLASAVYHAATIEDRRTAHRRLAAALDDAVQRGRHVALGAGEPSHAVAMTLESAASLARDRGMSMASAELLEHSLMLTPPDAVDDRHRRALATARAHLQAGEGVRARAIVDDLLAKAPTGPRRAEVLILASDIADPDPAVALLQQALEEARGVPALEATIHAGLAYGIGSTKGHALAEDHVHVAMRLAEQVGDDALRARALSMLAHLRFDRGDPNAIKWAERAFSLARPLPDPTHAKAASFWVGFLLVAAGEVERARAWLYGELDEWGDRDEEVRADALYYLALVELYAGRWTIASEHYEEAREILVQYGRDLPQQHFPPALLAVHRGEFEVARDHANRALNLGARPLPLPQFHGVLAICDLWAGSPGAAMVSFVDAETTADTRGWDEPHMRWWRADHAEALLQLGRVDDAARLVGDWETAAGRLDRKRVVAQAIRCRGLIAAARGDLRTALELLAVAVDGHEAVGDPFGRARALLALGVTRRRDRQKRAAREALEAALAGFETLGAASWAATTRAELARIGGRERIEGLSASEVRVAELVVEGHTNREIAAALFLGERTVAGHLTRIYAKLEVRSRTELTRKLLPPASRSPGSASKVERS